MYRANTSIQNKIFFLLVGIGVACVGLFAVVSSVYADVTSTSVTIGATVSAGGADCGNGVVEGAEACDNGGSNGACPAVCSGLCAINTCNPVVHGDSTAPVITNIASTTAATTATVTWNASDNSNTVSGCTFAYGLTTGYGSSGTVGGAYQSSLSGLSSNTTYFFRIRCTDPSSNTGEYQGSLITAVASSDTTAPVISAIATSTTQTGATIIWSASDNISVSFCSFAYGTTVSYGASGVVTGAYQTTITGLIPNTQYYCNISCVDPSSNIGNALCDFTTPSDASPPADVADFVATAGNASVALSWSYGTISDFLHYRIEWSTASCPARGAGTLLSTITDISQHTSSHAGLANGTTYYYSLFVSDTSGNYSAGVCASATPNALLGSVCGNSIIEAGETCDDGNAVNTDACTNVCAAAVCGDGIIRAGVEQCDSPDFNSQSCATFGHDGGALGCVSCQFSQASCIDVSLSCGDGIVQAGETCDDGNISNTDACTNACQAARCGDGVIHAGSEQCDSPEFNSATCQSLGAGNGLLLCGGTCQYDISQCTDGPIGGGEVCTNGTDDDADGFIDCADSDCAAHPSCASVAAEICNDGIDNDSDTLIDCADTLDCGSQPACQSTVSACGDGLDNDGDGLIDLQDSGCSSSSDTDEYNAPIETVPIGGQVSETQMLYWIAERTIAVEPIDGFVQSLFGDQLTIGIPEASLFEQTPSTTLTLVLRDTQYHFTLEQDGIYRADVLFPSVGEYAGTVEILYGSGLVDVIRVPIRSVPYGFVADAKENRLEGVSVALYGADGSLWNGGTYRQENPFTTDATGAYGFVVPNGSYKIVASKNGYRSRETFVFRVDNHVMNESFVLLALPETPLETITFLTDIATERLGDIAHTVTQFAETPIAQDIVAPSLAASTVAVLLPSLWNILLPLLRFLFLQPLLLLGKRKRSAWGVVYNSLTKLPVDLATIRLIDKKTNRVVQSRVTDAKGRYLFMVEPGKYAVEVIKQGFTFPSTLLASAHNDGRMTDIYHGEEIVVDKDDTAMTPNIPIDPPAAGDKTIRRIARERIWRIVQHVIALAGIGGTSVSAYAAPSPMSFGLLALHGILYTVFLRYGIARKPKGWGIVYDASDKTPVSRVVIRLFSRQFDKLVASQVTDSKGRYSFLVGPNEYYATFEKTGYATEKMDEVSVKDDDGVVKGDIALKKNVLPKT